MDTRPQNINPSRHVQQKYFLDGNKLIQVWKASDVVQVRSTGSPSGTSGNGAGDSGTSNSSGSNGGPNKTKDQSKTTIKNYNVTGNGVTYGSIDEKNLKDNSKTINNFMSSPAKSNK